MIVAQLIREFVKAAQGGIRMENKKRLIIDEIFLPYMVNNSGQTVFEIYRKNQLMLEG